MVIPPQVRSTIRNDDIVGRGAAMTRTWILCLGGLLWFGTSARGSLPSVDELLARYRQNADKYCGSFACKLEVLEESDVRMMPDPTLRRGKHVWHENRNCRWDGRRLSIRRSFWGSRESIPFIRQEDTHWSYNLFDLDREAHYQAPPKGKPGLMVYGAHAPTRMDLRSMAMSNIGGPSLGYFSNKFLDEFLRTDASAKVRAQMDAINGSPCYVLDVVGKSEHDNCTIWIDPSHGYNIAKLARASRFGRGTIWNVKFEQMQGAWVPVEWRAETISANLAARIDATTRNHERITEFLVNPDHETLKSFVLDGVPDGTPTVLIGGDGNPLPGDYVWRGGAPVPHVDREALERLNAIAASLSPGAAPDRVSASEIASLRKKFKGPYCGLYCLYLVMKMSGQDPNFLDLIKPQYVDMGKGSTLSGLGQAAEDAGLHAKAVDRANGRMLRSCPHAMILHVRGSEASQKYDHYILFLGSQAGRARICDPPELVKDISFAELESRWDGKALVVSTTPINLSAMVWTRRIPSGAACHTHTFHFLPTSTSHLGGGFFCFSQGSLVLETLKP